MTLTMISNYHFRFVMNEFSHVYYIMFPFNVDEIYRKTKLIKPNQTKWNQTECSPSEVILSSCVLVRGGAENQIYKDFKCTSHTHSLNIFSIRRIRGYFHVCTIRSSHWVFSRSLEVISILNFQLHNFAKYAQ